MQTVEKQVVLEENWQVLAVVFPPFAQRLENSVSRACWPGSMSLDPDENCVRLSKNNPSLTP